MAGPSHLGVSSRHGSSTAVERASLVGEGIATRAYQVDDPSGAWVVRVASEFPSPGRGEMDEPTRSHSCERWPIGDCPCREISSPSQPTAAFPSRSSKGGVPTQGISARWAFGAQTGEARPGVRLALQGVKANLQETKGPPS